MLGFQVKMIGIKDAKFMLKAQEDDLDTELLEVREAACRMIRLHGYQYYEYDTAGQLYTF